MWPFLYRRIQTVGLLVGRKTTRRGCACLEGFVYSEIWRLAHWESWQVSMYLGCKNCAVTDLLARYTYLILIWVCLKSKPIGFLHFRNFTYHFHHFQGALGFPNISKGCVPCFFPLQVKSVTVTTVSACPPGIPCAELVEGSTLILCAEDFFQQIFQCRKKHATLLLMEEILHQLIW